MIGFDLFVCLVLHLLYFLWLVAWVWLAGFLLVWGSGVGLVLRVWWFDLCILHVLIFYFKFITF